MKKLNWKIITGFILLISSPAFGDGNKLLSGCNAAINFMDNPSYSGAMSDTDSMVMGFCLGMMQGMTNLNRAYEIELNKKVLFCTPDGINNGQAARIVAKYLKEHPEMLHENESYLVIRALQEAYPCN